MVLVFGFAATPVGSLPTGMVAVTLQAEATAWDAFAGDAGVAAAGVVATGASEATAAVTKMTARWVTLMVSCLLVWQWQARIHLADRHARASFPSTLGPLQLPTK